MYIFELRCLSFPLIIPSTSAPLSHLLLTSLFRSQIKLLRLLLRRPIGSLLLRLLSTATLSQIRMHLVLLLLLANILLLRVLGMSHGNVLIVSTLWLTLSVWCICRSSFAGSCCLPASLTLARFSRVSFGAADGTGSRHDGVGVGGRRTIFLLEPYDVGACQLMVHLVTLLVDALKEGNNLVLSVLVGVAEVEQWAQLIHEILRRRSQVHYELSKNRVHAEDKWESKCQ